MEETFSTRKLLQTNELKNLNQKSDLFGFLQLGSHVITVIILAYAHALALGSWWVLVTLSLIHI